MNTELKGARRRLCLGTILMTFLGLIYAWSLFVQPLETAFAWNRSQSSFTFTVCMIAFCLGSLGAARLLRRWTATRLLQLAALLFASGFWAASFISTPIALYLSYGLLCGLGVGLAYNAIITTVLLSFPHNSGKANGVLLLGMGLGSLLLGSVLQYLIQSLGWQWSFRSLALTFALLFFALAPYIKAPAATQATPVEPANLRSILNSRDFYLLFAWSFLISTCGLICVSNAAPLAQEQAFSTTSLALVVGLLSVGNGLGRILFGTIFDSRGSRPALAGASCLLILAVIGFLCTSQLATVSEQTTILARCMSALSFFLCGLAYGAAPSLSSVMSKKLFGGANFPLALALVVLALIPAALLGPPLAAVLYQLRQNYSLVYYLLASLAGLALLPAWALKKVKRQA